MEQAIQLKKLANFDLKKEQDLNRLPVYDFLFHLQTLHDEQEEGR